MSEQTQSNGAANFGLPLVALAGIAGGIAYWMLSGNQAAEDAAKKAITKLGGVAVLDSSQQHVGTLNLQLIKGESEIHQAMILVSDLPYLQVLDASATPLGDDDLAHVSALSKLNSLHLNDTLVTDNGLKSITPLQQLHGLHMARTALTDKGLAQVAKLQSLVHLDVSGNKVGVGLANLKALPKLTWLLVAEVDLDAETLNALGELTQVKRLTIGDAESRPEVVKDLNQRLPGVTID